MEDKYYIGKRVKQKTLKEAEQRLIHAKNEKIICAVRGAIEHEFMGRSTVRNGLLIITTKRVIFYMPKLFGRYESEEYPLTKITSVQCTRGLLDDRLEIAVASDRKVIKWIPKGDGVRAAHIISNMIMGSG